MVAKEEIQVTLPQSWSHMDPERMDDTNPTSRDRIMVPKGVERPDFRGPPIRGCLFGNRIVEERPNVRPNLHGAPTIDTGLAGKKNGRTLVHRHL